MRGAPSHLMTGVRGNLFESSPSTALEGKPVPGSTSWQLLAQDDALVKIIDHVETIAGDQRRKGSSSATRTEERSPAMKDARIADGAETRRPTDHRERNESAAHFPTIGPTPRVESTVGRAGNCFAAPKGRTSTAFGCVATRSRSRRHTHPLVPYSPAI